MFLFFHKEKETCSVLKHTIILVVSTFRAEPAEFVFSFRSWERVWEGKKNCTSTVSDGSFSADANRS